MRRLKIFELKKLIFEEVKKERPEVIKQVGREIPQIPYPEARTTQAIENLKKVIGKELSGFGARTLLAALVDMSFSKLHKIPGSDKAVYEFYQHIYLEARKLLDYVKESSPY